MDHCPSDGAQMVVSAGSHVDGEKIELSGSCLIGYVVRYKDQIKRCMGVMQRKRPRRGGW